MDNFTVARIREDFIEPLADVVAKLNIDVKKLEACIREGRLTRDYLPLNYIQAADAVARLRRFRREEVSAKLEAALEGSLRYRETELEAEKAKRAARKAKPKTKAAKSAKPAK